MPANKYNYETSRFTFKTYYDIGLFATILTRVYSEAGGEDECHFNFFDTLDVFAYYFALYEAKTGREHPHINKVQIRKIVEAMRWVPDYATGDEIPDLEVEDYVRIINCRFQTNYNGKCNYNINHFFSGDIRGLRWHESRFDER